MKQRARLRSPPSGVDSFWSVFFFLAVEFPSALLREKVGKAPRACRVLSVSCFFISNAGFEPRARAFELLLRIRMDGDVYRPLSFGWSLPALDFSGLYAYLFRECAAVAEVRRLPQRNRRLPGFYY